MGFKPTGCKAERGSKPCTFFHSQLDRKGARQVDDECGKQSVLVQDKETKAMYGFVSQCKKMSCEHCGQRIHTYVQNKISMYTKRYNLKHFTTITLGDSDIKKLLLKFKELAEKTRELEKQSFINRWMKKNRTTKEKAEQKYYERVYNLYDQEHYYRWLYGKDLSKKKRIQIMFQFQMLVITLQKC
jgi:hypothetical protein